MKPKYKRSINKVSEEGGESKQDRQFQSQDIYHRKSNDTVIKVNFSQIKLEYKRSINKVSEEEAKSIQSMQDDIFQSQDAYLQNIDLELITKEVKDVNINLGVQAKNTGNLKSTSKLEQLEVSKSDISY